MSWSKAKYLQLVQDCSNEYSISATQLLAYSPKLPQSYEKLILTSVPSCRIETIVDPMASYISRYKPDALLLQLDPLRYVASYRKLMETMLAVGKREIGGMGGWLPRAVEECTVTRQNLEILAMEDGHDPKIVFKEGFPEGKNELIAIVENRVFQGHPRWPYLQVALYPSIISSASVVLCDLPEVLLRSMIANSITITEARDIFSHIVSDLQAYYKTKLRTNFKTKKRFRSSHDVFYNLYSHLSSPFTSRYMTAVIHECAKRYNNIGAWIGAHHVQEVHEQWPNPASLSEAIAVPPCPAAETDSDLIEKHAILEVILSSEAWEQPYIPHEFAYLSPTPLPSSDLQRAKECYSRHFSHYEGRMDNEVAVPQGVLSSLQ